MYNFTDKKYTTKYTKGQKNTCKYIIIHHTGSGTYKSNLKYLTENPAQASVHFIIGKDEEVAKCGEPHWVMRHSGVSQRGNLSGMNKYSLGIEVVGSGERNIHQLIRLTDLVEYLMGVFNIPKENVLRHCELTQSGDFSKKKILRDGKRSSRKVDIGLDFFGGTTEDFVKWRSQLTPRKTSRYGSA